MNNFKIKKIIALALSMCLTCSVFSACSDEKTNTSSADDKKSAKKITIGVSTWSVSDALGGQVKKILDLAADSLGCEVVYVEQEHKSEKVVESVENLCASGVDGIVICNSSDTEMTSAIRTCDKNNVYIAQFFRQVSDPDVVKLAKNSDYYLGCTHEDEVATGYNLGNILIKEKKARTIGITSYRVGDATANARITGYNKAVDEWNAANANDKVTLLPLVDNKYTSEEARQAVEGLIDANPNMDGLIVVGGGGSPLEGALAGIAGKGKTGKINVVSTDFTTTLDKQLASGEISAMSGGHYTDPLFSFLMVYNAITGAYDDVEKPLEVIFPMLYVASPDDYKDFDTYFVKDLPYTADEIREMTFANNSETTFDDLKQAAANLSIEDVKSRK